MSLSTAVVCGKLAVRSKPCFYFAKTACPAGLKSQVISLLIMFKPVILMNKASTLTFSNTPNLLAVMQNFQKTVAQFAP